MAAPIVVSCPECSQKYRLSPDKVGLKARCRCGQRFTIATEKPIDEETVFGWVVEEADPSSKSVLGSTGIVESPVKASTKNRTAQQLQEETVRQIRAGVKLDRIDELGAHFEFVAAHLAVGNLRGSFPKQCVSCSGTRNLNVHLIVWLEKLPHDDPLRIRGVNDRAIGKLQSLAGYDNKNWLNALPKLKNLAKPFNLPFPFYVCSDCNVEDEVTSDVFSVKGIDHCHICIANLEVAAKSYRNNGGRDTPQYARLVREAEKQKNDHWRSLPFAVRRQICQWHQAKEDETFKGFYPDADFSRAEAGKAGIVLTDRRLSFHKYSSSREFAIAQGGKVYLQPEAKSTSVRIVQRGRKDATANLDPVFAEKLLGELQTAGKSWKISGQVRPF